MQINSAKYTFEQSNNALKDNLQDLRAKRLDSAKKLEGIDEKVKVRWNGAATFISSAFAGLTSGGAAGLAAWTFSAVTTPIVIAAGAALGVVISPAIAPVVIGVGVGLGVTAIAAGLISGVAKLNNHFRIKRAEKQLFNIQESIRHHREEFEQKPVFFDSRTLNIPEGGSTQDRANVLTSMILHIERMSAHLEVLAKQSEAASAVLNKEHAVIQFACHDMLREYQSRLNNVRQDLNEVRCSLTDTTNDAGQRQYRIIKTLRTDLMRLESDYRNMRSQRLEFFDKQLTAQEQYVQTLKEKL